MITDTGTPIPSSAVRSIVDGLLFYPWYFLATFCSPSRLGKDIRPTPQDALTFLTVSTALIAVLDYVINWPVPALLPGPETSLALIDTLGDWNAHHQVAAALSVSSLTSIAIRLVLLSAAAVAAIALVRWRWVTLKEYAETVQLLILPICVVVVTMLALVVGFCALARSFSVPGWAFIAIVYTVGPVGQIYSILWIPFASIRSIGEFTVPRTMAATAVYAVLAILLVIFLSPFGVIRSDDADPYLQTLMVEAARLQSQGRERDSLALLMPEYGKRDSITLDLAVVAMEGSSLEAARKHYLVARETGIDDRSMYAATAELISGYDNSFEHLRELEQKYRDVPAVLLHLSQVYSKRGGCSQASLLLDAVFASRTATPIEWMMAGLKMRCTGRSAPGLDRLLTRFDMRSDVGSIRVLFASGLMFQAMAAAFGGDRAFRTGVDDVYEYCEGVLTNDRAILERCKCDPEGWDALIRDGRQWMSAYEVRHP